MTLSNIVNRELHEVSNWFKANKLLVNLDKSKFMIFSLKNGRPPDFDIQVKLDDMYLEKVHKVNFLGVLIDDKLSWKNHIDNVCSKVSMSVGIMKKLRPFLPVNILFTLYNALVLPYLDYCNLVWGRASSCYIKRLFILQKRAIRLCCNAPYREHTSPLFIQLNTLPLRDLIQLKTGMFVFRFKRKLLPTIFNYFFIENNQVHDVNIKRRHKLYLPLLRLTLTQANSIQYHASVLWNSLDSSIQQSPSVNCFKKTMKIILMNSL